MTNNNNPLIVVCGPTATGKTALAVKLAKENDGELISADSRQIYKHLDIGTGKDIPPNSQYEDRSTDLGIKEKNYSVGYYAVEGIPLWLYDVITPDKQFSASEYAKIARLVMADIWSRGKLPIVVGGTGFYIKALVDGIDTEGIPANPKLRRKLEDYSVVQLQNTLRSLDVEKLGSMNQSDRHNPRRLIRAIEVLPLQPQTISQKKRKSITNNVKYIGLKMSREDLYRQIDARVEKRVQQGIIDEIKKVLKMGYDWSSPGLQAIGYKEWRPYFDGAETHSGVIQKWRHNEHAYARRQLTWFMKDTRIEWAFAHT